MSENATVISAGWLLTGYCVLVMLASLAGGWLLLILRPSHARLQIAISFVAGLMLGIAMLHFLPDAAEQLHSLDRTAEWMMAGFLAMFFLQRFFHFHHHDSPEGDPEDCGHANAPPEVHHHDHGHGHDHEHEEEHVHHEHTLAARRSNFPGSARRLASPFTRCSTVWRSLRQSPPARKVMRASRAWASPWW